MAKLIGNQPNQVPTNGDLGTMAYQDYDVVAPQLLAGRRNLVTNGAMQVAQRGTQTTGYTGSGFNYLTADRFSIGASNLGTWTVDQSTDVPDGFSKSLKLTATTADASPASNDYVALGYKFEGQNLQHLNYGASSAKTMTLSFWVKSNKTGNSQVTFVQTDSSLVSFVASYSINNADTWEYKTVVIDGDTSGDISNTSGTSIEMYWYINSGSLYTGTSPTNTWVDTSTNIDMWNGNNLGVGGATSDYFAITGVQLEVGSVATPFEHRSYGEELALCQRYYQKRTPSSANGEAFSLTAANTSGANAQPWFFLPVTMRATPTMTFTYDSLSNISSASVARIGLDWFHLNISATPASYARIFEPEWTADAEL
jgi:hypothetical protein